MQSRLRIRFFTRLYKRWKQRAKRYRRQKQAAKISKKKKDIEKWNVEESLVDADYLEYRWDNGVKTTESITGDIQDAPNSLKSATERDGERSYGSPKKEKKKKCYYYKFGRKFYIDDMRSTTPHNHHSKCSCSVVAQYTLQKEKEQREQMRQVNNPARQIETIYDIRKRVSAQGPTKDSSNTDRASRPTSWGMASIIEGLRGSKTSQRPAEKQPVISPSEDSGNTIVVVHPDGHRVTKQYKNSEKHSRHVHSLPVSPTSPLSQQGDCSSPNTGFISPEATQKTKFDYGIYSPGEISAQHAQKRHSRFTRQYKDNSGAHGFMCDPSCSCQAVKEFSDKIERKRKEREQRKWEQQKEHWKRQSEYHQYGKQYQMLEDDYDVEVEWSKRQRQQHVPTNSRRYSDGQYTSVKQDSLQKDYDGCTRKISTSFDNHKRTINQQDDAKYSFDAFEKKSREIRKGQADSRSKASQVKAKLAPKNDVVEQFPYLQIDAKHNKSVNKPKKEEERKVQPQTNDTVHCNHPSCSCKVVEEYSREMERQYQERKQRILNKNLRENEANAKKECGHSSDGVEGKYKDSNRPIPKPAMARSFSEMHTKPSHVIQRQQSAPVYQRCVESENSSEPEFNITIYKAYGRDKSKCEIHHTMNTQARLNDGGMRTSSNENVTRGSLGGDTSFDPSTVKLDPEEWTAVKIPAGKPIEPGNVSTPKGTTLDPSGWTAVKTKEDNSFTLSNWEDAISPLDNIVHHEKLHVQLPMLVSGLERSHQNNDCKESLRRETNICSSDHFDVMHGYVQLPIDQWNPEKSPQARLAEPNFVEPTNKNVGVTTTAPHTAAIIYEQYAKQFDNSFRNTSVGMPKLHPDQWTPDKQAPSPNSTVPEPKFSASVVQSNTGTSHINQNRSHGTCSVPVLLDMNGSQQMSNSFNDSGCLSLDSTRAHTDHSSFTSPGTSTNVVASPKQDSYVEHNENVLNEIDVPKKSKQHKKKKKHKKKNWTILSAKRAIATSDNYDALCEVPDDHAELYDAWDHPEVTVENEKVAPKADRGPFPLSII